MSPKKVVGCRGGSRNVEGCLMLFSVNSYYFRLINGLIGSFLAFYSALGSWLTAKEGPAHPWGSKERRVVPYPSAFRLPPLHPTTFLVDTMSSAERRSSGETSELTYSAAEQAKVGAYVIFCCCADIRLAYLQKRKLVEAASCC